MTTNNTDRKIPVDLAVVLASASAARIAVDDAKHQIRACFTSSDWRRYRPGQRQQHVFLDTRVLGPAVKHQETLLRALRDAGVEVWWNPETLAYVDVDSAEYAATLDEEPRRCGMDS